MWPLRSTWSIVLVMKWSSHEGNHKNVFYESLVPLNGGQRHWHPAIPHPKQCGAEVGRTRAPRNPVDKKIGLLLLFWVYGCHRFFSLLQNIIVY